MDSFVIPGQLPERYVVQRVQYLGLLGERLLKICARYKIIHIAYWTWCIISQYHQWKMSGGFGVDDIPDLVIMVGTYMVSVYCCLLYLLPRYFEKERYLKFVLLCITTIASASVVYVSLLNVYNVLLTGNNLKHPGTLFLSHIVDTGYITLIFVAATIIYKLFEISRQNNRLVLANLETELNFLKAQINPHFVFNALNSIYVLIAVRQSVAQDVLLKFSNLLRYQLYECSERTVQLEKEIAFISDYIELERIRNGDQLQVQFEAPKGCSSYRLAPFLLIPFIENAFKHVSRSQHAANTILIRIAVRSGVLSLHVRNTYTERLTTASGKGIGLQNVIRRLELLYPGRHTLNIAAEKEHFTIDLNLDQHENSKPYS